MSMNAAVIFKWSANLFWWGASQQLTCPRANLAFLVITTVPAWEQAEWAVRVFEEHKAQSFQVNSVPTLQLVL